MLVFAMCIAIAVPLAPQARVVLLDVFCGLLVLLRLGDVFASPMLRRTLLLFAVYSMLLLLSAEINGLPLGNFVRRDYGAFLLLIEALGIYLLLSEGGFRRHLLVIGALMLGICCHYFWPTDSRITEEPIKFLVGVPLGVLLGLLGLLAVGATPMARYWIAAVYLAYAAYCVLNGNRSVAAVFIVSALLANAPFSIGKGWSFRKIYPWLAVGGLVGLYLFTELYAAVATTGLFGQRQADVAEFQEQVVGSLLIGGRPEILINLLALSESPFIGHGPIAMTPKYLEAFYMLGIYSDPYFFLDNEQAMYHSMLFGAGQEAGVFAMLFWVYLGHRLAFAIPVIVMLGRRVAAVGLPIMLMALWHVPFSPLNSYSRWIVAVGLALALYWADRWQDYARETAADPDKIVVAPRRH